MGWKADTSFDLLFNASQTSMAVTEEQSGRIVDVNDQWVKTTGISRDLSIGKTGIELKIWVSPSDRQALVAALSVHGNVTDYPTRFNMLSGSSPHLVCARVIQIGGSRYILWELKDVTFLATAESRVLENEARYQSVVDNSTDAIQVFDLTGAVMRVNSAWETMWGVPFSALRDYNLFDDPQLAASGTLDILKRAYAGSAVKLPAMLYDKSKSESVPGQTGELWIEAFVYPVFGDNGKVFEVVVVQHDVTLRVVSERDQGLASQLLERRVLERTEQVLLHHNRLETILNGIPGVVGYWDQDERNVYANAGYKEWLGTSGDNMLGKTIREVFGDERYRIMKPRIEAVFAGEQQSFEGQFPYSDKPSEIRYAEIHYVPEWHQGKVVGFFVLAFDISKLRQLALEAKASSSAKSTFLSNMSHEIRTPLNAVVGMAYMLKTTTLDNTQKDYVAKMESASQHLMEIVNDVLDLSKIEAEKITLESKAIHVGELVGNVVAMLTDRATVKSIVLHMDVDIDHMAYQGDPTRLQQILLNFGSNAIKFSDKGDVWFSVQVASRDEATTTLRFEVKDQGIGIPVESLGKLFNAFVQVDSTTTRKFGGTGLGLAISKRIAELMGGQVGVESSPGKGSVFWFTACLENIPEDSEMNSQLLRESLKDQLQQRFKGTKVLLADDEPVNLEIASFLLNEVAFVVEPADDGEQAVEVARQQSLDLVILDMQMPKMDGLEAARRIKALPLYKEVPIVAMTGNVFLEDRERCKAAGMDLFVPKPINAVDFYDVLWHALTAR